MCTDSSVASCCRQKSGRNCAIEITLLSLISWVYSHLGRFLATSEGEAPACFLVKTSTSPRPSRSTISAATTRRRAPGRAPDSASSEWSRVSGRVRLVELRHSTRQPARRRARPRAHGRADLRGLHRGLPPCQRSRSRLAGVIVVHQLAIDRRRGRLPWRELGDPQRLVRDRRREPR